MAARIFDQSGSPLNSGGDQHTGAAAPTFGLEILVSTAKYANNPVLGHQ
jgi:hypothetical protein